MKTRLYIFIFAAVTVLSSFSQENIISTSQITYKAAIDIAAFGVFSYSLGSRVARHNNWQYEDEANSILISNIFMTASSGIIISTDFLQSSAELKKPLLWTARAGYLAAITSSLIWILTSPNAGSEGRISMTTGVILPSITGIALTFLPEF
jgi:hypothetical protein